MFKTFKKLFKKEDPEKTMSDKLKQKAEAEAKEFKANIYKDTNDASGINPDVFMIGFRWSVPDNQTYIMFSNNVEVPARIVNTMFTFSREMEPHEFMRQEKLLSSRNASEEERINNALKEQGIILDEEEEIEVKVTTVVEEPAPQPEQKPFNGNPLYALLENSKKMEDVKIEVNYTMEMPFKSLYVMMAESFDGVDDIMVDYYMNKLDIDKLKGSFEKALHKYINDNYVTKKD